MILKSLESMQNYILIDHNSTIIYINQNYCEILNRTQEDTIGRDIREVIPNTLMPEIVKTGETHMGSLMNLYDQKLKKEITIVCSRIPIFENQKIIGAVAITTLTDMKEIPILYKEIQSLKSEKEEYLKKIEELMKKKKPLIPNIIGNSLAIEQIKKTITDYAKSELSILITGETGVGKEIFANAVHELSDRKGKPYIKINCASLPYDLLESELFGYEEGAFTGAKKQGKIGRFEAANGGTLFLDEIGEMPLSLQAKLLRVLQEQEIEKIGAIFPIKIDVRIICSTNRNLFQFVREKKFREDLYYRINTVEIEIPPLRERIEDIDDLVKFFIQNINQELQIHTLGMDKEVLEILKSYDWPGNIRELKHIVERLSFINKDRMITKKDCDFVLKKIFQNQLQSITENYSSHSQNVTNILKKKNDMEEITLIINILKESKGNKSQAAKKLGIDRSLLYYKMKKYNIQ